MPELSGMEIETARLVADFLSSLEDFQVHTGIGGHGVVGVLHNGDGPKLLLRADMDALPVLENTGLSYASKRVMKDRFGQDKPVMHACGHDTHVASLMAVAKLLTDARGHWQGTLICLFQPSEEHLNGAEAMVNDGLYESGRVPRPDVVLAQHVDNDPCGRITMKSGPALTASSSLAIRIFGRGGHGSSPQDCIDPIVIGCSIVTKLQTIVSREIDPNELAVVTCGSISAGDAANIIPEYLDLTLNIRSLNPIVHNRILCAIKRIVEGDCKTAGCDRLPTISTMRSSPATINDDATVEKLKISFSSYFGAEFTDMEVATASEDVSILATAAGAPLVMWFFGGSDPDKWNEAKARGELERLPQNHSELFAPVIECLGVAVDAMALAALTLFAAGQRDSVGVSE
ncbi:hypothetical protein NLG97_g3649 [Lecanicillium saksenae]|uniref:Uncharacterized protein n=1 Tax=Lecanicillium saksenae TaxID=468837 RepID=A0ACC1QYQ6_9HYPO|nr:hypothetical protein NLG97_g3649 [Lecanicillium saksenae]